jgi:hypothetical protein
LSMTAQSCRTEKSVAVAVAGDVDVAVEVGITRRSEYSPVLSAKLTFCLRSLHLLHATLERDRLLGRGLLSASTTIGLARTMVARSVASA